MQPKNALALTLCFIAIITIAAVTVGITIRKDEVLSTTLAYLVQDYRHRAQTDNLMLGSSSIRRLDVTLLSDCGSWLNRGIGNSIIPDLRRYLRVSPLAISPSRILIYAGENDVARKRSVQESFEEYVLLLDQLIEKFPTAQIHMIGIKPSPSRKAAWEGFSALNDKLQQYAQLHERLFFHPFNVSDETHLKSLFTTDGIHLTRQGYQTLISGVAAQCKAN